MSEDESHHHGKNEIIIIKRHGGHHEGHHGGAWKIAYADFMTAMMAFFLVMWLVNAANDATKAAVASYFNPIKLTDAKPAQKGIKKPGKDAEGEATQDKSKVDGEEKSSGDSAATGQEKQSTAGEQTSYSEADYFENPYAVLSEIVLEVGDQANVSAKGEGGAQIPAPRPAPMAGKPTAIPSIPTSGPSRFSQAHSRAEVQPRIRRIRMLPQILRRPKTPATRRVAADLLAKTIPTRKALAARQPPTRPVSRKPQPPTLARARIHQKMQPPRWQPQPNSRSPGKRPPMR